MWHDAPWKWALWYKDRTVRRPPLGPVRPESRKLGPTGRPFGWASRPGGYFSLPNKKTLARKGGLGNCASLLHKCHHAKGQAAEHANAGRRGRRDAGDDAGKDQVRPPGVVLARGRTSSSHDEGRRGVGGPGNHNWHTARGLPGPAGDGGEVPCRDRHGARPAGHVGRVPHRDEGRGDGEGQGRVAAVHPPGGGQGRDKPTPGGHEVRHCQPVGRHQRSPERPDRDERGRAELHGPHIRCRGDESEGTWPQAATALCFG